MLSSSLDKRYIDDSMKIDINIKLTDTRTRFAQRLSTLSLFAFLVAGCASLDPIEQEPEFTAPPSHTVIWDALSAASEKDRHVLLNDGLTALDWRLRAIDSASDSIDFQTFLWYLDTTGAVVLDHVIRAADRGVTVRILVDDTFLVHEDKMLLALASHPNIEYRVFNPFKRRSGGAVTRQLLNLGEFRRLDHRMHNKAMLVDNQVAIVGGRNIANEYFGLDEAVNFRDLEIMLNGPIVQTVGDTFDKYWNDRWSVPIENLSHKKASNEQLSEARAATDMPPNLHREESADEMLLRWLDVFDDADSGEAILYSDEPPDSNPKNRDEAPVQVAHELVQLFDEAESEIVIVSAYLIPTPNLEGAVQRALARGVRVRMLTNSIGSNNHLTAHSAYRNHIDTLLQHGAEIHEVRTDANDRGQYMTKPVADKKLALHAKALIIDSDKVFIGSANLDPRSLRINTEMGFVIISEAFNREVRLAVEGDFLGDNAWRLELQDDGQVFWVSNDKTLESQPAVSTMQRIEDWFFSHLPIEGEL